MNFPQFTLVNDWRYKPFLLRHDHARYFVLFSERLPALQLASLYCLQPPRGLMQIDHSWELMAWLKAAKGAGAECVWLDPVLDCQAIDPCEEIPIMDLIEEIGELVSTLGEAN